MRYIKVENNVPKDYTIEQLLIDYPDAVIYKRSQMPNEKLLANYNVYPLITEAIPTLNEDEKAEESIPEFQNGEWHQTWIVKKLTEDEINKIVESRIETDIGLPNALGNSLGVLANEQLQTERYNICKTCDSLTTLKTCRECGCIMPLKVKLATARCPLEKW